MALKKYFPEVLPIEALRKQFREYCLRLHPDKGGNPEEFKSMKAEYDAIIQRAATTEALKAKTEERKTNFTWQGEKELMEAIERFVRIQGIIVEVCGSWLWIGGNTFPVHQQIKSLGAKYSKPKKRWYYSPYMFSGKIRGKYSMEKIRRTFGSVVVESEAEEKVLTYSN